MTDTLDELSSVDSLLSDAPIVAGFETQEEWEGYRRAMLAELRPVGPVQLALAEHATVLAWRLRRGRLYERAVLDSRQASVEDDLASNWERNRATAATWSPALGLLPGWFPTEARTPAALRAELAAAALRAEEGTPETTERLAIVAAEHERMGREIEEMRADRLLLPKGQREDLRRHANDTRRDLHEATRDLRAMQRGGGAISAAIVAREG